MRTVRTFPMFTGITSVVASALYCCEMSKVRTILAVPTQKHYTLVIHKNKNRVLLFFHFYILFCYICIMIKTRSIWKGVHWDDERQMWRAEIKIDGTVFNIGFDHNENLAYDLYCAEKSRIKGWRNHLEEGLHLNPLTGKYHAVVEVNGKLRSLGCSDGPEYAQQLLDEYSTLPEPVRTNQPKKHRGVTFDKKRGLWCAKLRGVVLGYFADPDAAGETYRSEKAKSRKYEPRKPKQEGVNYDGSKYVVSRDGKYFGKYDDKEFAEIVYSEALNCENLVLSNIKKKKSKHKCVYFDGRFGKWYLKFMVSGKTKKVGFFHTEESAFREYQNRKGKNHLILGVMYNSATQKYEVMRGGVVIGEYDQEKDAVMAFVL